MLLVIEVSPEAEEEDLLKPAWAERQGGGAQRFCEVYRAVGAMATAGGKLFLGELGSIKSIFPAESASHEKYKSRLVHGRSYLLYPCAGVHHHL